METVLRRGKDFPAGILLFEDEKVVHLLLQGARSWVGERDIVSGVQALLQKLVGLDGDLLDVLGEVLSF